VKYRLKDSTAVALAVLAPLTIWQLYVDFGSVERLILPSPTEILKALASNYSFLLNQLLVTASEVVSGLIVAALIGGLYALQLHISPLTKRALYPQLVALQALPVVVVAPLLITWLGFGFLPKLVIVALACFFPITVAVLDGLRRVDSEMLDLMNSLQIPRTQILKRVELPSAMPQLFSGLKIAVPAAVTGAVFAEMSGSQSGLFHTVMQSIPQLETAQAYAAVLLLGVLAIALFFLVVLFERLVVPWAASEKVRK